MDVNERKLFALVSVKEFHVDMKLFETFKEAHEEMCKSVAEEISVPAEVVLTAYSKGCSIDDGVDIYDTSAFCEVNSSTYQWAIFDLANLE